MALNLSMSSLPSDTKWAKEFVLSRSCHKHRLAAYSGHLRPIGSILEGLPRGGAPVGCREPNERAGGTSGVRTRSTIEG